MDLPAVSDRVRREVGLLPWPGRARGTLCAVEGPIGEAYAAMVARVGAPLEAALPPGVLGNRVRSTAPLVLEDWRAARDRFDATVRGFPPGPGLRLDVQDCYASIRPEVAARACEDLRAGAGEWVARALRTFERLGVRGLPVGPTASDVLANAVLLTLDRFLEDTGAVWVRWVDDVLAVADAPERLRALEQGSARVLAGLGLRWNPAKRRPFAPGAPGGIVTTSRAAPSAVREVGGRVDQGPGVQSRAEEGPHGGRTARTRPRRGRRGDRTRPG